MSNINEMLDLNSEREEDTEMVWCPFAAGGARTLIDVVVSLPGGKTDNVAQANFPNEAACIGSRCMAWRYLPPDRIGETAYRGYCGLVGKP